MTAYDPPAFYRGSECLQQSSLLQLSLVLPPELKELCICQRFVFLGESCLKLYFSVSEFFISLYFLAAGQGGALTFSGYEVDACSVFNDIVLG